MKILTLILALLASGFTASADEIESAAGYRATPVENGDEGGRDTVITREGKVLASVRDAAPVSFSPNGEVLLVREAMPDDDCRHFLLNLKAKEFRKDPETRLEWVIGGRYVTKAEWSEDGKFLTLTASEESGGEKERIEVAKFIASSD